MINLSQENILARMQLPVSPMQLAVFRVVLGMQILYSSSSYLFELFEYVNGTTYTTTIFPKGIDRFINLIAYPYLSVIVQGLSILMMLGLFTRYVIPLLFVSFLMLFSYWYNHFDAPVPWLYLWFPLLVLCFSRCYDALALDNLIFRQKKIIVKSNVYRWPMEMVIGWFAYIYCAAGLAKILPITKGFTWFQGGTSQSIIYDRFLDSAFYYLYGTPFFDYSSNHWVFASLSLFSLIIELSCILLFFTRRFNYNILMLVLLMHFFLYLTGVPGFMQLALVLGVAFIRPEIFNRFKL